MTTLPSLRDTTSTISRLPGNFFTRLRRHPYILILLFLCTLIYTFIIHPAREGYKTWLIEWEPLPAHVKDEYIYYKTPSSLHGWIIPYLSNHGATDGPPEFQDDLLESTWAGSWPIPKLQLPVYKSKKDHFTGETVEELVSPAILMLHVFTTSLESSRNRRKLIREYSPLKSIPQEYRHLVEIKFVMGKSLVNESETEEIRRKQKAEIEKEEEEIRKEQKEFGDLVRLENLWGGENMNEGKSIEWMRWVGRKGGRETLWALKCDEDTLPLMPNLLDLLTSLDASKPTYIGSSVGHWKGFGWYFGGMMYGFSWGVLRTVSDADIPLAYIQQNAYEDARVGNMLFSLPSKPLCSSSSIHHTNPLSRNQECLKRPISIDTPPPNGWDAPPLSPDPRTGLVRTDLGNKLGGVNDFLTVKDHEAIGWHWVKWDEDYINAYNRAVTSFQAIGKEYIWKPPKSLRHLAERIKG